MRSPFWISRLNREAHPAERAGFFRGRHYLDWIETVDQLKRGKRYEEAAEILRGQIAAAEAQAFVDRLIVPPGYAQRLAVVERAIEREKRRRAKDA